MTEKTLEQAIEIKRVIDRLRNKKEELEETRNLIFSKGENMSNQEALNEIMISCVMVLSNRIKFEKAINIAMEALRKQIPIKVIVNEAYYSCPVCGTIRSIKQKHNFCHDCGQALDWED